VSEDFPSDEALDTALRVGGYYVMDEMLINAIDRAGWFAGYEDGMRLFRETRRRIMTRFVRTELASRIAPVNLEAAFGDEVMKRRISRELREHLRELQQSGLVDEGVLEGGSWWST
jgi:hypothetical protein